MMVHRANFSWCLLLESGAPAKITATVPLDFWNPLSSWLSSSFFLTVFFSVSLTIFSYVSIIKGVAISDGVISSRVPDAMHVFNVIIPSGF